MNKKISTVSIIIVNYNGCHLLGNCLNSLEKLDYPKSKLEVIVVDNASSDSSVYLIKHHYPWIKLIELSTNEGFSGGNNVAMKQAKGEYLVLLNNDTIVSPTWLKNLTAAAAPSNIGIVSSKLLFSTPYIEITIKSSTVQQSELDGSADFTPRGVLLENVITRTLPSHKDLVWYSSGFSAEEMNKGINFRWATGISRLFLPVTRHSNNSFSFTFHGYPTDENLSTEIELLLGEKSLHKNTIAANDVSKYELTLTESEIKDQMKWFVQNAGNIVLKNGYSKDRGSLLRVEKERTLEFYEEDTDFYDQQALLTAACGAGMLVKKQVIDEIGFLDGYYFMYYEDIDFSVRAWRMGWDILYEPSAVIYHHHRASTGKDETSFIVTLTERNHLFFVFTHFPLRTCIAEYVQFNIRLAISILKQFKFRFTEWEKYQMWRNKSAGRFEAWLTFHKQLFTVVRNRTFLKKRERRSYQKLEKLLY